MHTLSFEAYLILGMFTGTTASETLPLNELNVNTEEKLIISYFSVRTSSCNFYIIIKYDSLTVLQ